MYGGITDRQWRNHWNDVGSLLTRLMSFWNALAPLFRCHLTVIFLPRTYYTCDVSPYEFRVIFTHVVQLNFSTQLTIIISWCYNSYDVSPASSGGQVASRSCVVTHAGCPEFKSRCWQNPSQTTLSSR